MDWSWLVTLVCPLMMIFMMFGMKGGHNHKGHKQVPVEQVQQELSELRAQNELMRVEMQNLKDGKFSNNL